MSAAPSPPTPSGSQETLWQIKARVEADFPDFPNIDVSAPGFSRQAYMEKVMDLFFAMGFPHEDITLSWHNLTCTVPVEKPDDAIKTFASAFDGIYHLIKNGTRKARHMHIHHVHHHQPHSAVASSTTSGAANDSATDVPKTANVLNDISGVLEPGTMTLVLGPSGSGSSLLLSRIAGRQIGSLVENHGKVLYNGEELLHGIVRPSHFVQHIGQFDDHIPEITVRHTLEFAAHCKWPEWMPHVEAIRRNDVLLTARMLRIERTLETIVGNDILRGVSGGERKRATIAEMLIGLGSGAVVMDNWSKGLDASTTLSITRSMREYADESNGGVIASMQAPGVQAFNLFDTILVLEQGLVLYYGPRDQAENWFLRLGFKRPPQRSVPDFITTIANPEMRPEYLPRDIDISELERAPPQTVEEFAARFAESAIAAKMNERVEKAASNKGMVDFDVPEALRMEAGKLNLQKPRHQLKALGKRLVRFYGATRKTVFADFMQNLILGVILGSIFWQLPDNAGGASTRAGILFLALLFIGLSSLAKLRDKYDGKRVFAKQRDSSFYNAVPYIFMLGVFDIVVELVRTAVFLVPLYLMSGLNIGSSGQRLLYAILVVALLSLIMISLTRSFAALFDDPDAGQGIAGIFTIISILFSGFMKPRSELDAWLRWVYWMDPIHYVFEALALNEYEGLTFSCDADEKIPAVSAIPPEFRICTVSTGEAYLKDNFGITEGQIYRLYYFIILVAYLILFFGISAIATALVKPRGHALKWRTVNGAVTLDLDPDLDSTTITVSPRAVPIRRNTRFTFSNVRYAVQGGARVLLDGITGHSVGGKVVLLMGESGAGKSTLLDVCALRKTMKKGTSMDGDVRLNGHPVTSEIIAHHTGYCEQTDLHIGEATVREAVHFSAKLRLPTSVPDEEKNKRAEETLELLGLASYGDILVKALGQGELKLLTMALEVVANPIVLFLDEPTSGISAASALVVANALRKIADTGTSVICTIHQPSKEVFGMFDQLLLLKRGGRQVYFGDIGDNGVTIQSYFESKGASRMNEDENTADWMLDVIADEKINYAAEWHNSDENAALRKDLENLEDPDPESDDVVSKPFRGVGRITQIVVVVKRLFLRYWRLPEYNFTRVVLMFTIALIVGLLFLRDINDTQAGASLAFAALFLTVIPSSLYSQNVIPPTADGRTVFYREVASGTYKPLAFHVALGAVEVPFTFISAAVFAVVFYFLVGLDPSRFFYFFLAAQLLYYFSVAFGVALSAITAERALALNIASSVSSVFNVLSGFFIRKDQMPDWWRWSTWINPYAYYLSGLVQNQMEDRSFRCLDSELGVFQLPPNFSSCQEIGDFADTEVNGTAACLFCPIPSGDALIDQFGADAVNKWVSLVALIVAILICRTVAGIGFAKLRFLSR